MTFQELFEAAAKDGKLPRVRYIGPRDHYLPQKAEGQIKTVKQNMEIRMIGVYFPRVTNWETWFYELETKDHRQFFSHLEIIS